MVILGINYYVIDVFRTLAAAPQPEILYPIYTYVHRIEPLTNNVPEEEWIKYRPQNESVKSYLEKGERERDQYQHLPTLGKIPPPLKYSLSPVIGVIAKASVSFDIQLYLGKAMNAGDAEHEILMNIEIVTNMGNVRTGEFVLIISPYYNH